MASCRALNARVKLMLCPVKWELRIIFKKRHSHMQYIDRMCNSWVVSHLKSLYFTFTQVRNFSTKIQWENERKSTHDIESTLCTPKKNNNSQAEIRPARRIARIQKTPNRRNIVQYTHTNSRTTKSLQEIASKKSSGKMMMKKRMGRKGARTRSRRRNGEEQIKTGQIINHLIAWGLKSYLCVRRLLFFTMPLI